MRKPDFCIYKNKDADQLPGLGQVLSSRQIPVENAGMANTPKITKVANTGII